MRTKQRFTGFLMGTALVLTIPFAYADNGNGGNLAGGQATSTAVAAPSVPAATAVPPSVASEKGEHHWKHKDGARQGYDREGMLFHKLQLTDAQKQALKPVLDKQKETFKATFKQMKANREAYEVELLQKALDMTKITELNTQMKTIQAQMIDDHLSATLEVRKVLTPEQFVKYLRIEKGMMAKGFHKPDGQGRGHWNNHGDQRHEMHS